jgi:hypothetical protein
MNLIKAKIILASSLVAGGLTMVTGCAVDQNGHLALVVPTVVVAAPAPVVYAAPVVEAPVVVEEPVLVPETYVAVDGVFFGFVGEDCVYLGPGGVWMACEPWRLDHFHDWERGHRDWREHMAIHNDRFRRDVHGHSVDREGHVTDRSGHPVNRTAPGKSPRTQPIKRSEEKK